MKVYIVQWGYHSCNDGGVEIGAIYSTYEKALNHIKTDTLHTTDCLRQTRNRLTKELIDHWSDGDYWTSVQEGFIDSPSLYMSKEECERLYKEI